MSRKNKEEFGIYSWGNLDGTHVEVLPRNLPGINKKQWFGRKKYASINCLAAVTRDGQFCFISNSHPSSVHDSPRSMPRTRSCASQLSASLGSLSADSLSSCP